jgi:hypothetical protein
MPWSSLLSLLTPPRIALNRRRNTCFPLMVMTSRLQHPFPSAHRRLVFFFSLLHLSALSLDPCLVGFSGFLTLSSFAPDVVSPLFSIPVLVLL